MKKIVLMMLVFVLAVPWTTAFAAEQPVNLISGKKAVVTNLQGAADNSKYFTDGDLKTDYLMIHDAAYTYIFEKPVDVSNIVAYNGYAAVALITFRYSDVENKTASVSVKTSSSGPDNPANLKKVISLTFSTGNNMNLREFQVFGVQSEFINPEADKFAVSGVKFTAADLTSGSITWNDVQSKYFKNYNVYKDNVLLGSPTNNRYSVSGLDYGKTYKFKVTAVDTWAKEFSPTEFSYTTPLPDTTPPTVPKLSGSAGNKTVNLEWTPSPDDDLAGYRVYQDGQEVQKGQGHKTSIDGLTNGKTYRFSVTAFDTSGNESAGSNEIELTPKSVITDTEQEAGPDYLLVKWTKTEGAIGYRIYLNGRLIGSVGPAVYEYKITRAMGYIPGAISNKAEARAILADGTEGGSNNPTAPVIELGAGYGVGDAFKAGIEFVKLLNGWVLVALAIVLANMIIAFIYLLNKKYKAQGG
ncbi:fibronectin type III domain-containing protein [Paenibacillus kribbensis]|uniref:fibronectin type III domain-containing protein n=1 Tax=Paenibacillus kribbensis TaxID=172713 RepID=UPI000838D35E|nr:hypothetical protein [Paenibacillus kribbensis]